MQISIVNRGIYMLLQGTYYMSILILITHNIQFIVAAISCAYYLASVRAFGLCLFCPFSVASCFLGKAELTAF